MSYTLYVDESKTFNPKMFCVAGEIIRDSEKKNITCSLNNLKKSLWNGLYSHPEKFVLHQSDIRNVKKKFEIYQNNPYRIFGKQRNVTTIFEGIGQIIDNYKLPILGCIVDVGFIDSNYGIKNGESSCYYLSLNSIIDTFTHFLTVKNDTGNIVIESRATKDSTFLDEENKKYFFKIMSHGTKHYSAKKLQQRISGINFYQKMDNNAGLQIADFISEPLVFNKANISQKPSIYQVVKRNKYIIYQAPNPKDSIQGIELIR